MNYYGLLQGWRNWTLSRSRLNIESTVDLFIVGGERDRDVIVDFHTRPENFQAGEAEMTQIVLKLKK